jgi:spermidine/putrescine transport system permease protein
MTAPTQLAPVPRRPRWERLAPRADLVGLIGLVASGLLLVAVGARWVSGALATVALVALFGVIVTLIGIALLGGPEARRMLAPYGLLKPGTLWLALFYLAPLWTLLRISLSSKESRFSVDYRFTWEWSNYADAFRDFGPQFERAFVYAATATILTIIIGYPLAYVIAFRGGRYKNVLLGLVVVPFFTSYLIRTIAWSSILADSGVVAGTLRRLHLVGTFEWLGIMDNGRLLNTPAAVIGGLTYNFLPFMILPIYVSLEKIDVRLVDAAQDLYSTSTAAFRKVVLPLSLPGVFAGTLLTFIPAAGDFVNAQFLGSPTTTMIGNSIQDQFLRQNNYPLASAMSFVLMLIITVFVIVYSRFFGTEDLA